MARISYPDTKRLPADLREFLNQVNNLNIFFPGSSALMTFEGVLSATTGYQQLAELFCLLPYKNCWFHCPQQARSMDYEFVVIVSNLDVIQK